MTLIRRTSPFGELLSLRQAMDRLFEDSFVRPRDWGTTAEGGSLPLDIYATKDALVVKAALPGIRPDDVEITITGDALTISGTYKDERETNGEGGYVFQELRRGTFTRTVTLPADLQGDRAAANFENGLLTLTVPKSEQAKPRQIRISPTAAHATDAASTSHVESGQPAGER